MKRLFALLAISTMMTAAQAAEPDTLGYDKFRFGGYGEMVANFKDYGITPGRQCQAKPQHDIHPPLRTGFRLQVHAKVDPGC